MRWSSVWGGCSSVALALAWWLAAPGPAAAKVFLSKQEALELAFPDADRVETLTYVLTPDQVEAVEARARAPLPSKIVAIHRGWAQKTVLGYAFLDVHTVRTLPEAFLVVLSPKGEVRSVRVLAFHEPLEYLPPPRWLAQFEGVDERAPLRVSRDIHGIAGSTLSAHAVTGGVRRALALHRILVRGEE